MSRATAATTGTSTDGKTRGNVLLTSLAAELRSITSHLEHVALTSGQTLFRPGDLVQHAHFPIDALLSCLILTEEGISLEFNSVGPLGVFGLPTFYEADRTPFLVTVQVSGSALRVPVQRLAEAIRTNTALRARLVAYAAQSHAETTRWAACHRFHTTHQRLCRWLLEATDQLQVDTLRLTQEQLSTILGVQRTGITAAAVELQDAGALWYRRGRIRIVNRRVLEQSACSCYEVKRRVDTSMGRRSHLTLVPPQR